MSFDLRRKELGIITDFPHRKRWTGWSCVSTYCKVTKWYYFPGVVEFRNSLSLDPDREDRDVRCFGHEHFCVSGSFAIRPRVVHLRSFIPANRPKQGTGLSCPR